ncbi:MAG: hypothetical protein M3N98_07075, partial [Actinomycetota bacterium]|nr:hypothetical protein [Actinomycetota bacterium]
MVDSLLRRSAPGMRPDPSEDWRSPSAPSAAPPSRRPGRTKKQKPSRQVVLRRRVVLAIVLVLFGWFGWSYSRALTRPGNDSFSIRSVEWLKDHYLAWAVNDIERYWYTHHPPKKGGAPTGLQSQLAGGGSAPGVG